MAGAQRTNSGQHPWPLESDEFHRRIYWSFSLTAADQTAAIFPVPFGSISLRYTGEIHRCTGASGLETHLQPVQPTADTRRRLGCTACSPQRDRDLCTDAPLRLPRVFICLFFVNKLLYLKYLISCGHSFCSISVNNSQQHC